MRADPAQGAGRLLVDLAAAALLDRALGADHDREVRAAVLAGQDLGGDRLDGEGDLGEQDDVGPAAKAGVERDPAGVAAHHLQHHHPVVAGRGGVEPVEGLGGHGQGGVEAEGAVTAPQVVVDRLGHPDRPDAVAGQLAGDPLAALAADHDQGVDAEPLGVGGQLLVGGRVADPLALDPHGREVALVGGAEDGAAPVQQPADRRAVQGPGAGPADQALEALLDAEHRPAVVDLGRPDHRADDRVQPRCVATTGEHPDASDWRRHVGCTPSFRWVSKAPSGQGSPWRHSTHLITGRAGGQGGGQQEEATGADPEGGQVDAAGRHAGHGGAGGAKERRRRQGQGRGRAGRRGHRRLRGPRRAGRGRRRRAGGQPRDRPGRRGQRRPRPPGRPPPGDPGQGAGRTSPSGPPRRSSRTRSRCSGPGWPSTPCCRCSRPSSPGCRSTGWSPTRRPSATRSTS